MDLNLVYAKTPTGDEAVRQSTRVVQRNLRMVLVQVDGKTSVSHLSSKIGNPRLVENALRELEEGGYIAPIIEAVSVWGRSKKADAQDVQENVVSALSEFSTFGPKTLGSVASKAGQSAASNFSSFGKPILPATGKTATQAAMPVKVPQSAPESDFPAEKRRFSILRWVALGGAAVLATLIGTVVFFPYERLKPDIEAAASQIANAPVRIEGVGIALFPSPHLKLTGLQIGSPTDGRIAEVNISSLFSLFGKAPYRVSRIDIRGASLAANRLVAMPMFRGEVVGDGVVSFAKMHIEKSQITMGEQLALSDLYGDISFRPDGAIEKVIIETVDRSLVVDLTPGPLGVALSIEGRAWKLPGSGISFASLQARGLLQRDKLLIQNIDTTFLGGLLRGNCLLDWSAGLSMAGDGALIRLDSRKVSAEFAPALNVEGDMTGTVRLRSNGRDWDSLWRNTEAVLSTEITRGTLHGVDLGEAARRGASSEVRAGATKFDRLRSTINITPKQVIGRDVRMDAGMVTAIGQFVAERNGQVEGSMAVTLQSSVSSQHAAVRVYGTLPDLSATTRQ